MLLVVKIKIIATIGPASDNRKTIKALIKAGVDVFRFNFKHSTIRWHDERINLVRQIIKKEKKKIKLMADIQGPEGRTRAKRTLFDDDFQALFLAKKYKVEKIALSFTRSAKDIQNLREFLSAENFKPQIIAKIENRKATKNFKAILKAADAIMVARGDLGIELSIQEVPYWQKEIIRECRKAHKPVIVATEILHSMTKKPEPTRAEIADVAQAVYDGASALLLSGETAVGKYPVKAVKIMRQTTDFIEKKIRHKK